MILYQVAYQTPLLSKVELLPTFSFLLSPFSFLLPPFSFLLSPFYFILPTSNFILCRYSKRKMIERSFL